MRSRGALLLMGLATLSPAACGRKEVAANEPEASRHADEAEARKRARMAASATVPIEQAVAIASRTAPGTVFEAELEEQGGKAVWEVEIVAADGRVAKVLVDATSGSVLPKRHE